MSMIELPGGTCPIDAQTWSGPLIPGMVNALLEGDINVAASAYSAWAETTGIDLSINTFPSSDADSLRKIGRPRLAALLINHGLLSDNPTVNEPGEFSFL